MRQINNTDFQSQLRKMASYTQLPLGVVARAFNVPLNDIFIGSKQYFVPKNQLDNFEENIGFSIEDAFDLKVDSQLLKKRLLGQTSTLPDRYCNAQHSCVRTTANMVEFIKLSRGWSFTYKLLAKLQMHFSYFEDLDRKTNFLFFMDLFDQLTDKQIDQKQFRQMAYVSILKNRETWLGELFAKAQSDSELFKLFEKYAFAYDTNFKYEVAVENGFARIEVSENQEVKDQLKLSTLGQKNLCLYKQHFFSLFPLHRGAYALPVTESSCIYEGDSCCSYTIAFQKRKLEVIC